MTEIKTCPFCGSVTALVQDGGWFFVCRAHHRFQFPGMEEETLSVDVLERALEEWNQRWSE